MKNKFCLSVIFCVVLWNAVFLGFFISCEEPIEPGPFTNKTTKEQMQNAFRVETVPYRHNDRIVISWKKVRNAASYFVYVLQNKTDTLVSKGSPDFIAGPNTLQHTIKISSNFTETRYVTIVARDSADNVLFTSDVIEGKTLGKPIINTTQVAQTFYNVTFAWSPVEGVSAYIVQRREKGIGEYAKVRNAPTQSADGVWHFVDEDVKPEVDYEYRVLAHVKNESNVVAESSFEFLAKTPKQDAPSEVKNFTASEYIYSDRVVLMWNPPDALAGKNASDLRYTIERREKRDANIEKFAPLIENAAASELMQSTDAEKKLNFSSVFKNATSASLVYQDKSAQVNKLYEYKITAAYAEKNKVGNAGKPNILVQGAIIPKVTDLRAQFSSGGVLLQWTPPHGFTGAAEVERSRGGLAFETISTDDIVGNSYTDSGPHIPTKYMYRVRLIPAEDVIAKTSRTAFNKGAPSDSVDYEYPNVASHAFNFSISQDKKNTLKFSWDVPQGITVDATDFSIEKEKAAVVNEFEVLTLSSGPVLDKNTHKAHATLTVTPAAYKATLYRVSWKSGSTTTYSKVVLGDVLRAPTGVSATQGKDSKYITVHWQANEGAHKYEVKLRKDGSSALWTSYQAPVQNGNRGVQEAKITPPNNDKPLERGVLHTIRVVAVGADDAVDRVESGEVTGSTFGPAGMNVRARKGTSIDEIEISWNAVAHAEEYVLWRKTQGTSKEFKIAKIVAQEGKTTYSYSDLVDKKDYLDPKTTPLEKIYFQVYEYSIVPKRPKVQSTMASAITKASEGYLLGSPRTVEASNGVYGDKVEVRWKAVGAATEYVVYVSQSRDADFVEQSRVDAGATAVGNDIIYRDISVDAGEVKYYRVRSVNALRIKGRMPDEKVITEPGRILGKVTGVQASDVDYAKNSGMYIATQGATTADYTSKSDIYKIDRANGKSYATKITWDNVPGAKKYYIYRMDFNEIKNFWRKIGERKENERRVFFDVESLVLREYRALYWVVAFAQDKNGNWHADVSLSGDAEKSPSNFDFSMPAIFDAGKQTQNIEATRKQYNVDVGSRWITPREYLNWSLAVIGDGVYTAYNTSSASYGLKRSSWAMTVNFTMENYSLGAKADDIGNRSVRKARESTELVVNSNGALSGSCYETSPNCGTGVWAGYRAGGYIGNGKAIGINSPYGQAFLKISSKAGWSQDTMLYYNFQEGTIEFAWDNFDASKASTATFNAAKTVTINGKNGFEFSKTQNAGTKGALNPYLTPIGFNRVYKTLLKEVYGR